MPLDAADLGPEATESFWGSEGAPPASAQPPPAPPPPAAAAGKPKREPPGAGTAKPPTAKPRTATLPTMAPDRGFGWLADCQQTSNGAPIPNVANVAIALRRDANLADLVAHDDMAGAIMLRRPVPARAMDESPEPMPRPLRDSDAVAIQEYLQLAGMERLAGTTVHDAITLRAREAAYHPVRDYLTALRHDGTPRIDGWLTRYLGADASPYTAGIGRMFLLAMVARIMQPGCKCDYMLVLEGAQGARKSTACRILGGQWFGDSLPDVRDGKAAAEYLAGMWLVEVAELSAISRAEDAALKAFLTRDVERYRPSYGRLPVVQPRQCVFIGTTNKDSYLRDETGGRRFWPVKVGHLDTDALAADRDQLFAEAVAAWRSGGQAGQWWPSGEWERTHAAPQQAARHDRDIWHDPIARWVADKPTVTLGVVALHALGLETGRQGQPDQRRIAGVLTTLGWSRKHTRAGWVWSRA